MPSQHPFICRTVGGESLENSTFIFHRTLLCETKDGSKNPFTISITAPIKKTSNHFECKIHSENIIFEGFLNSSGIDEIDAIDFAIRKLDTVILNKDINLYWPDGSKYIRHTGNTYKWE